MSSHANPTTASHPPPSSSNSQHTRPYAYNPVRRRSMEYALDRNEGAAAAAAVASPIDQDSRSLIPPNSTLRVQPRVIDAYEWQEEYDLPWCGRIALVSSGDEENSEVCYLHAVHSQHRCSPFSSSNQFLVDIVLVPIRVLTLFFFLFTLAFFCRLLLIGSKPQLRAGDPPFSKVRTWLIRTAVKYLGRPILWSFGIVTSVKTSKDARTNHGILVAPHIGYSDIMAIVCEYQPSVVAKLEIASYPFFGTIARALQCIFIDRKDPADRQRVLELMRVRGASETMPPLLIFPEGSNSNGITMLRFQKGIFSTGLQIQPIAIRSHFIYYNAGWVSGSIAKHAFGLMLRLYNPISMKVLPLYTPSQAELQDPVLYADNVCQTLANSLNITVSQQTMYDNPELAHLAEARRKKGGDGTGGGDTSASPVANIRVVIAPVSSQQSLLDDSLPSLKSMKGGWLDTHQTLISEVEPGRHEGEKLSLAFTNEDAARVAMKEEGRRDRHDRAFSPV